MRSWCRSSVNVATVPPPSLKNLLVRTNLYDRKCRKKSCLVCTDKNGICESKGVVYKISCLGCSSFYIGETGQPLDQRYKQHLGDMKHAERDKPWSIHMLNAHGGIPTNTKIEVLSFERNLQRRKIKEANFIDQLKPDVNIRKEMNDAMRFLNPLGNTLDHWGHALI